MKLRPKNIRTRLTLWSAAVLSVILVVYATAVYSHLRHSLLGELDRQLHEDFEWAESHVERGDDGGVRWRATGPPAGYEVRWLSVRFREGEQLYAHCPDGLPPLPSTLRSAPPRLDKTAAQPISYQVPAAAEGTPPTTIRLLVGSFVSQGGSVTIAVGRSLSRTNHELGELLLILLLGLPMAVAVASWGGWLLAGRALAPVERMAVEGRRITAQRLADRLPIDNPDDELGRLAGVFNETLGRLEASFHELTRFTADASHELRTPLAAIRSVGETALTRPQTVDELRAVIGSMLEEADRMARLVDGLLTLARADDARFRLQCESLDLVEFAGEVAALLGALAQARTQAITVVAVGDAAGAEGCPVTADRAVLRQALVNLVDNAIKYGPAGTPIVISVGGDATKVWIAVVDQGEGIPEQQRARVFERFYRVEKSRARELGGAGLGLAIARWAVEIHGGRIEVRCDSRQGCEFRIELPALG